MKRNGKGVEEGDSSRGSASAAGETTFSGRGSGGSDDMETLYRSMLTRNALRMLAGNGSLTGNLGLRFGGNSALPNGGAATAAGGSGGNPQAPDVVRRLSMDECWKLILQLGTRWPAWNEAIALQATLATRKENNEATDAGTNGGHHLHTSDERDNCQQQPQQDFLKQLANRALEALAAQPPSHPRHRGGVFTIGTQTMQGRLDSRVAAPEAPTISTPPFQQPSRATLSSRDMPAPRTPRNSELTIFYDGSVNVCDNVPPDKARLIMMFAEKAGLTQVSVAAQAEASSQKPPHFRTPAPSPSTLCHGPSIPKDFHESKPIPTKVPLLVGPSPSIACESARPVAPVVEGSSSQVKPPFVNEALERAKQAIAQGKASMPNKITTGTQPSKPRQVRSNVMLKPLPNARRNSLARFLDSRKRQSTFEEVPPKKPALGEGSQSDAEDLKSIGKPLFSQSSKELKEETN